MKLGSKDYLSAVTQSTLAAFVGMIASMAVLGYYLWKLGLLKAICRKPNHHIDSDIKGLLLETLKESIPFIVTGSAIQAFQLIDQWTFVNTMTLLQIIAVLNCLFYLVTLTQTQPKLQWF